MIESSFAGELELYMSISGLINSLIRRISYKDEGVLEYPIIENSKFGALDASDISSHLSLLYFLVHLSKPGVIVELGTRDGQSTRALRMAADELGIRGVSVDLSPAPDSTFETGKNWTHLQEDDIVLANKLKDSDYRMKLLGTNSIDFLFLDTSHEYLHTKRELDSYWPLISDGGLLILHDSNLSSARKVDVDGRTYRGWDNARGVSRAVEDFFNLSLNEKSLYSQKFSTLTLLNLPWNNGLLLIQKNSISVTT